MRKESVSLKVLVLSLVLLLMVSAVVNIYMVSMMKNFSLERELLEKCNLDVGNTDYQLLSPDIAWLTVDAFVEKQQYLTVTYSPLKNSLSMLLDDAQGEYALYFEDLTTGAWTGINEKEEFTPLSLLKVPTMVATLKEVELGRVSLDTKIVLLEEDLNKNSGDLWKEGAGYELTVKDLLIRMIQHSDNTAVLTLNRRVISDDTYIESRLAMGLPAPALHESALTAKGYSNILRGLYFSNYLRRPFSELALTMMLETDFNSQIPAGVPKNIKVAHKIGFYDLEGYYHDCGIVYAPNKPYILCIMSKNTSSQEADRVMSQASKIIYSYITKNATHSNSTTR